MPAPKKHGTSGKKRRRRSHLHLTKIIFSKCEHCAKPKLAHTVCKNCGYYGKDEVINVTEKELKKQEKKKQRK